MWCQELQISPIIAMTAIFQWVCNPSLWSHSAVLCRLVSFKWSSDLKTGQKIVFFSPWRRYGENIYSILCSKINFCFFSQTTSFTYPADVTSDWLSKWRALAEAFWALTGSKMEGFNPQSFISHQTFLIGLKYVDKTALSCLGCANFK